MSREPSLDSLRASVVAAFPALAGADFVLRAKGWDSLALEADGRLIFKFPRDEAARESLVREARLLAVLRPRLSLPVPDLRLHHGPPLFSWHAKIPGEHLEPADYARLPEPARQALAATLARFFAELHAIPAHVMAAVGAQPIRAWLPPDEILARLRPLLSGGLRRFAEETVAAWRALPPDPCGRVYGFFDGHGWNLAFDQAAQRLNGVYDFGDSGFGELQQEFVYPGFVSPDLTARVAVAYEGSTGRRLDRERIALLGGILRLSELADYAHDPQQAPALLGHLGDWVAQQEGGQA